MSPPIMSRFDLFFVVLDECDETTDYQIARHIVNVHRFRDDALVPQYTTEQVQRYIQYARTFKPKVRKSRLLSCVPVCILPRKVHNLTTLHSLNTAFTGGNASALRKVPRP